MTIKLQPPTRVLWSTASAPAQWISGTRGVPTSISGHATWIVDDDPTYDALRAIVLNSESLIHSIVWQDNSASMEPRHVPEKLKEFLKNALFREPTSGRQSGTGTSGLPHILSNTDLNSFPMTGKYQRVSRMQELFEEEFDGHVVRLVRYDGRSFNVVAVRKLT